MKRIVLAGIVISLAGAAWASQEKEPQADLDELEKIKYYMGDGYSESEDSPGYTVTEALKAKLAKVNVEDLAKRAEQYELLRDGTNKKLAEVLDQASHDNIFGEKNILSFLSSFFKKNPVEELKKNKPLQGDIYAEQWFLPPQYSSGHYYKDLRNVISKVELTKVCVEYLKNKREFLLLLNDMEKYKQTVGSDKEELWTKEQYKAFKNLEAATSKAEVILKKIKENVNALYPQKGSYENKDEYFTYIKNFIQSSIEDFFRKNSTENQSYVMFIETKTGKKEEYEKENQFSNKVASFWKKLTSKESDNLPRLQYEPVSGKYSETRDNDDED